VARAADGELFFMPEELHDYLAITSDDLSAAESEVDDVEGFGQFKLQPALMPGLSLPKLGNSGAVSALAGRCKLRISVRRRETPARWAAPADLAPKVNATRSSAARWEATGDSASPRAPSRGVNCRHRAPCRRLGSSCVVRRRSR